MQTLMRRGFQFWIILIFLVWGEIGLASQEILVEQTYDSQSTQAVENKPKKDLTLFFLIGLIINLIMLSLFIVWAVREWRKTPKKDETQKK